MKRGKFIVIEGGEGSGKSTMTERLKKTLPADTVFTRDPGGIALGEKIRDLVLSREAGGMDTAAELLLFMAARAQLIAEVIAPALESGIDVISDRFILSTVAYQVYGRQKPEYLSLIKTIFDTVNRGCVPDLTIFLDIEPEAGLRHVRERADGLTRFDAEELAFHRRVREGYRKHLGEYGKAIRIDSDRVLEEVWTDVKNAVQSNLHIRHMT